MDDVGHECIHGFQHVSVRVNDNKQDSFMVIAAMKATKNRNSNISVRIATQLRLMTRFMTVVPETVIVNHSRMIFSNSRK
jgi:hypothetical protein